MANLRKEIAVGDTGAEFVADLTANAKNANIRVYNVEDYGAVHDGETDEPEHNRADREVHEVLHDDVAGILGAGEARLHHGEASLHEEHQRGGQQYPYGILARNGRYDIHCVSSSFGNQKTSPPCARR